MFAEVGPGRTAHHTLQGAVIFWDLFYLPKSEIWTAPYHVDTQTGVHHLKATGRGLKATGRGRKLTLTRFFVQAFFQFHGRLRGALPRALPLRVRARSPSLEAVAVLALTYPTHCRAFAGRRLWSSSLTTRARRPAADNILSMARCLWS